jgi:hypothetical protein
LVLFFKKEHVLLLFLLASCSVAAEAPPVDGPAVVIPYAGYKVVLVAGDDSIRVFDNAVAAMRRLLLTRRGFAPDDVLFLSATHSGDQEATLQHVMDAIADMKPAIGQGCLVFATSHGVHDGGLWLSASQTPLSPLALDLAVTTGCGDAPTVVLVSACFSGSFAQPPMARPNRIILTAARPDRTSFGCKAGRRFTVYDQCLLRSLAAAGDWRQVYDQTRGCVGEEELREQVVPSEPQGWFGDQVANLPVPPVGSQISR